MKTNYGLIFFKVKLFLKFIQLVIFLIPITLFGQSFTDSNVTSNSKADVVERIQELNRLAAILNADSTNEALVYAHEAYLLSLQLNNKKLQAESLLNLSEGYLYNDSYDQALQYAFNALDISEGIKSKLLIAQCYTTLGWIFYDTENANFSMQYHTQAHGLYKELGDTKKACVALNAIGLVFQMQNKNDSAKFYFNTALQIARQEKMTSTVSAALNNLGICENVLGNYTQAISYLNQALQLEYSLKNELSVAETQNQLAFSYLKIKDYGRADSLLKSSQELINGSTSNTRKEKLLDNLHTSSQLYQALGNYKKAFDNQKEYTDISNEIISRNKSEVIAALQLKRDTQEKEKEINELNAQKELRNFQRNVLAVGVLLIIVISLLWYRQLKHKQKKEKELDAMKQLMIKQELENSILEKKSLNNKLEYKNADLKNYALYISQRNELIREFIDDLNILVKENETKKDGIGDLHKMIKKFQQNLEINKEARDFNLSFDEMHADFFFNLLQKYPELTENERRLSAQIRLNLSIKEIASLNNISVKSVEMARYRLRKHFNMQQGEDLNDFLKSF